MDEKERVLLKVKKMLALANDAAASETERETALRMIHATLAKHNLSMAQAEIAVEDRGRENFTLREYAWMRTAGVSIGTLFFCEFLVTPLPKKHAIYIFIGRESNTRTASLMTSYIINSINREGSRQAVDAGETPRGTYWRDFCKGAVHRIYQRCQQLKRDSEQTPHTNGTGTSMVLASLYASELAANRAYLEQIGVRPRTRTTKERRPVTAGYGVGIDYGNRVNLNKQLGSK